MNTLVIATRNPNKFLEFKKILKSDSLEILSLDSYPYYNVKENGKNFEENALIKAKAAVAKTGLPALADDSGLEVLALKGKPGIFSARFAGEDATDEDNNKKLLDMLQNVPKEKRQARFVCSLALAFPNGDYFIEKGYLEGYVTYEPKGNMGFGYDPIIYLPKYEKTVAELLPKIKNKISHRAKALEKMKKHVLKYLS